MFSLCVCVCVCVCFNRGDPSLVKTNVAITTGYLISGKRASSLHRLFEEEPKEHACTCKGDVAILMLVLGPISLYKQSLLFCFDCNTNMLSLFPLYFLFRSAANILLLEGDRRQVFCSSSSGSVVCLLLCTGECPIVQ